MRILILTFEFVPFSGGIATYTYEVACGLAELGCDIRVLAPKYPKCEEVDNRSKFQTVRMRVKHGKNEASRFLPGYLYLGKQIEHFKPEVLLLTSDLAHGLGALKCVRKKLPFVAVVHGSEIVKHFPSKGLKKRFQAFWLRFCYRRAARVVCISTYVGNLMRKGGFAPENLCVIHNGIDESLLSTPMNPHGVQEIERRYDLRGKKVLLTIARVVERKGQAQVIRALPEILTYEPNLRYMIVGAGKDAGCLQRLARDLGMADRIIFTGEIPEGDKLNYLDACHMFVLASRSDGQRVEGLGISLLEAAARAKPLIGTRHGGISEVIEDGVNGFLVDPSNRDELVQRVRTLLKRPDLCNEMGRAAKEMVAESFTRAKMAMATKELLENVVRSKSLTARQASPNPP